jgi:cytidylate kinase
MDIPATVTIARQLGSAGSYLGQRLAALLGYHYVDREVLRRAADELHMSEEVLAGREERLQPLWGRVLDAFAYGAGEWTYVPPPLPMVTDEDLFTIENRVMAEIAARENCVIVGRAAFRVLPPSDRQIHLFCHAPLAFRLERVKRYYNVPTDAAAQALIEDSDRVRCRFVTEMCGVHWECAEHYHLCVDTSLLPLDDLAEVLARVVRGRLGEVIDAARPPSPG